MWIAAALVAGLLLFLVLGLVCLPWYMALSLFCIFMSWKPKRSEWARGWHLGGQLRVATHYTTITSHEESLNLDKRQHYMFAMHPHNVFCASELLTFIFPNTLSLFEEFTQSAVPLVASELLWLPGLGHLVAALGCESVGRDNLLAHVHAKHSVALIPGGIREMALAPRNRVDAVYIIHREGFLRIAYENRVPVVPILSLGEHTCHRLFASFAPLQRFCIYVFGYPFPMLAFGRWLTFWPLEGSDITLVTEAPHVPEQYDSQAAFIEQYYAKLSAMADSQGVRLVILNRDGSTYGAEPLPQFVIDGDDEDVIQERSKNTQ